MSITFSAYVEHDGEVIRTEEAPNFANANARLILAHLDLPSDEPCGSIDVDELLGRCLTARAAGGGALDDSGFDGTVTRERGRATMIDFGLRPGYFADAVDRLEALCHEAKELGATEIDYA